MALIDGGRPAAETEAAREWIVGLPVGTWFTVPAVPAPKQIVNDLIKRLLADAPSIIGRAARGLYWRQPPSISSLHGLVPRINSSFYWAAAPPGSGYADWNALLALGWGTQVPVQVEIAVPIRNLVPPRMPLKGEEVGYKHRPNPRRRDLNWNEATLLEGARSCGAADPRLWGSAISGIVEGNWKYKPRTPINKERLLWAAESERADSKWPAGKGEMSFGSVVSMLASDLPDVTEVG